VVTCYKTTLRVTKELSMKGILCSQQAHGLRYPAIFLAFAEELARYITVGYETLILDIPPNEEELHHIGVVFDLASKAAGVRLASKGAAQGAGKEQFL